MSYKRLTLSEFDREIERSRAVLASIPDEKLSWRPHPRSNPTGWQANHIAGIVEWLGAVLTQPSFDIAPSGAEPYKTPEMGTIREILEAFDRNAAASRAALEAFDESTIDEPWSLLAGGQPLMTMPREAVVRDFVLSHMVHHRAILCLCLRLNDIPVPAVYGPSGDEEG